jgi:SAM-dependent methyltransferase
VEPDEYDRLFELEEDHWRSRGLRRLVRGALLAALPPRGTRRPRVLDAGCGCGFGALRLEEVAEVVAVDAHPRAVAHARRRGLRRLARAEIARLPFPDGCFEAVVCVDVLYHRAVDDDAAALAELARVCRRGGPLLLVVAAYEWMRSAHDAVVHTRRRYTRARLRSLAGSAGLEVERLSHLNSALLPLAALRRLVRGRRPAPRSDLGRPPAALNALLAAWLGVEAELARRVTLPFGLSIFAVLRRPARSFDQSGSCRR